MLDRSSITLALAKAGGARPPEVPPADDWQGPTEIPEYANGEPIFEPIHAPTGQRTAEAPSAPMFDPITPLTWKGTEPVKQRWLAGARVPSGDLTILAGNGGSGKTEIATSLLVSVAADLGDWLGSVVESGPALFISCEEDEMSAIASNASLSTAISTLTLLKICTCSSLSSTQHGLAAPNRALAGSAKRRSLCRSKPGSSSISRA